MAPHFGATSLSHHVLEFLLPALQKRGYEIHLITHALKNVCYRWKGVFVYSADHTSIEVIKRFPCFSVGLYINQVEDEEIQTKDYPVPHWFRIDQQEWNNLLKAIHQYDYVEISTCQQNIINNIELQIQGLNLWNEQEKAQYDINFIAPVFESSEEGSLARGLLNHAGLHHLILNPVYLPSYLHFPAPVSIHPQKKNCHNLIIIPEYYSWDEIGYMLYQVKQDETRTIVIYPRMRNIRMLLEEDCFVILSSHYLKKQVLNLYGVQHDDRVWVIPKCIPISAEVCDRQRDNTTRFITVISPQSETNNLDFLCTAFVDLFKDIKEVELHLCFLSNSSNSESFHYYNNMFTTKQSIRCHLCPVHDLNAMLNAADCYISINTADRFDCYTLHAAASGIAVMTAHHDIAQEYFDQSDLLIYEFERETILLDQHNNAESFKHTVRKESIATAMDTFVHHKELILTKAISVKEKIRSTNNMNAWMLMFDYHIKNKIGK